jgi:hypothetical protein
MVMYQLKFIEFSHDYFKFISFLHDIFAYINPIPLKNLCGFSMAHHINQVEKNIETFCLLTFDQISEAQFLNYKEQLSTIVKVNLADKRNIPPEREKEDCFKYPLDDFYSANFVSISPFMCNLNIYLSLLTKCTQISFHEYLK